MKTSVDNLDDLKSLLSLLEKFTPYAPTVRFREGMLLVTSNITSYMERDFLDAWDKTQKLPKT